MKEKLQTMGVLPPHFTLCQYVARQSILYCSPTFIFCHFTKLILSWLLITVFLINFLSWRKTSPQKHNDCFQIWKIVIHCRNRIAFSIETLQICASYEILLGISFILHAVESKKLGSEANEKPLRITTEDQNIGKS